MMTPSAPVFSSEAETSNSKPSTPSPPPKLNVAAMPRQPLALDREQEERITKALRKLVEDAERVTEREKPFSGRNRTMNRIGWGSVLGRSGRVKRTIDGIALIARAVLAPIYSFVADLVRHKSSWPALLAKRPPAQRQHDKAMPRQPPIVDSQLDEQIAKAGWSQFLSTPACWRRTASPRGRAPEALHRRGSCADCIVASGSLVCALGCSATCHGRSSYTAC